MTSKNCRGSCSGKGDMGSCRLENAWELQTRPTDGTHRGLKPRREILERDWATKIAPKEDSID